MQSVVMLFAASFIASFALIEGGERAIGGHVKRTSEKQSQTAARTLAVSKDAHSELSISDRLRAGPIGEEDLARAIRSASEEEIRAVFGIVDPRFWSENPDVCRFVRLAAERLSNGGVVQAADETSRLLSGIGLPDAVLRRLAAFAFAGSLAKKKPAIEEMAQAVQTVDPRLRRPLLRAYLNRFPGAEPAECSAALQKIWLSSGAPKEKDFVAWSVRTVMEIWTASKPEETIAFAKQSGADTQSVFRDFIRLLAAADSKELGRQFASCAALLGKEQLATICSQANIPFPQLAAMARNLPEESRKRFLTEYYEKQDALQTLEFTFAFAPGDLPANLASRICSHLIDEKSEGVIQQWLSSLPEEARDGIWDQALGNTIISAAAAESYLSGRSRATPLPKELVRRAIESIAGTDFQKALGMAAALPFDYQQLALKSAYQARLPAFFNDPASLTEFCTSIPAGFKTELTTRAAGQLGEISGDAAMAFCAALEEPLKAKAEAAVLARYTVPIELLERVCLERLSTSSTPEIYAEAAASLVNRYALMDSRKAIECIDRLPEGPIKVRAISSVVATWCITDPVSASEWVAGFPPGETLNQALFQLSTTGYDDPSRAFDNAATITDLKLRSSAINSILEKWRDVDPSVAADALLKSRLSDADKAKFKTP